MEGEMSDSINFTDIYYEQELDLRSPVWIESVVIYSVLLYVGLCANIWMLWTLYKTWKSGSRVQVYLLTLSVWDIVALCIRCGVMIGMETTGSWEGGYYGCVIFLTTLPIGYCVVHLVLASFNIDNMITIICNHPVKCLRTVLISLSIVVTIIASMPKLFFAETTEFQGMTICTHNHDWLTFAINSEIVFSVVMFWFPLLLILLFGLPALCMWCSKKGQMNYESIDAADQADMKNIGRDIALVLMYDVVFVLCWGPHAVYHILSFSGLHSLVPWYVVNFLSVANSSINPFVYAVFYCMSKRNAKVSPGL